MDGEAFYVYVKELDTFQDDYASQIALSCGSLQEGTNKIVVPLQENSKFLSNLYKVIVNNIFTEFRFLEEVVEEAALYQITLDVTKGCDELNLVDESIELPGKLQFRVNDEDAINDQIRIADFTTKPGIIFSDGTTLDNQSDSDAEAFTTELVIDTDFYGTFAFDDDTEWLNAQEAGAISTRIVQSALAVAMIAFAF